MQVIETKLLRNGEYPVLFADDTLRKFNFAKVKECQLIPDPSVSHFPQIVCRPKQIDLTKVNFYFPIMVDEEKARKVYQLS